EVLQQLYADAIVLALDAGNLGSVAILQNVILVREHLHGFLVGQKILHVIQDENPDSLGGIFNLIQPFAETLYDGRESVLLNEVEQLLFGFEIVIKPGQGHATRARKVAHGGAFVSFFAEDIGGVGKNFR